MINFNETFNRKNTNCWKWDGEGAGAKFPMGCADTDFKIAPPIANALHDKINQGALTYPHNGTKAFKAFSNYFKRHYNSIFSSDDICSPIGTMLGLKIALESYSQVNDYIIIQSPVFSYFKDTAHGIGRKIIENKLIYNREQGIYSINFKELEEQAANKKSKIMIICNPANPTGNVYSKEELIKIIEICNKNNIILIVDEIYADFTFKKEKHISVYSLDEKYTKNCILLTGTGKTFNIHGFYTAFFVISNSVLREKYNFTMKKHRLDIIDLGMVAAEAAYTSCDDYVFNMKKYIESNLDYAEDFFQKNNIQVKLTKTKGTYLLWLDFLDWKMSSEDLFLLFKSHGLILSKGSLFAEEGDGFMRMNIACQLETLKGALNLIKSVYFEKIYKHF